MVDELEAKLPQIEELCKKFGVVRLDLFGSAARGDFDPERSDFDFFVKFGLPAEMNRSHQYFGLIHALEDLLGRQVHLAEDFPGQRADFLAEIQGDRLMLYAA